MSSLDRISGALAGLATGDALGRQLLIAEDLVGTPIIAEQEQRGSDATQQAALAARALLWVEGQRAHRLVGLDVLGERIAEALVAWYHVPPLAEDGPSRSTLMAAARLTSGLPWDAAANLDSDGAGVLHRAIPFGLRWAPADALLPALVAASVTHRHPNALEGAAATAWLVSALVRGEVLSPALVREARDVVVALDLRGQIADTLDDALAMTPSQVLDPEGVRPGGGGRRAGSALGLAIAVAMQQGGEPSWASFELAIDQSARVQGRGDLVASLTGAFLGATWGWGAVPRHLFEHIVGHQGLLDLARNLYLHASEPHHAISPWEAVPTTGACTFSAPDPAAPTPSRSVLTEAGPK